MAPHEVDVSWQVLREIAREWAGSAAELDEVTPLAGGSINTTLALHTQDNQRAVLKITPHRIDKNYADEVYQLETLRQAGVPVPRVYRWATGTLDNPFSFLLMEFMEGVDLSAAKATCSTEDFDGVQAHLAELVALLHERRGEHYMRLSADGAKRYDQWHDCYRQTYGPIWQDVEKSGVLPPKTRKQIAKIHDHLDALLAHDDCPRLVHWDLWASNILVARDAEGRWRVSALLDPACKYAHAEAEIAYLELFHTITPTFLRLYQQTHKLPPEYHLRRKGVYHLYSLIDHLHLFGQDYLKSVLQCAEEVAQLV